MTRGKFVLITKDRVYISTEFNGDMYPDGYGVDVFKRLLKVKKVGDFFEEVKDFNKKEFGYEEKLVWNKSIVWLEDARNFKKGYFDRWFSDRLYIKNLSGKTITFKHYSNEGETKVKNGKVYAFNFGNVPDREDKDYLIKELEGNYAQ